MEHLLVFFTSYSAEFIYIFLFGILLLSGLGLPVPEDAVLLSGGFLVYIGYTKLIPTVFVCFFGVLCGDILMFLIGQKLGTDAVRHKSVAYFFTPKRLSRVQNYFRKHGTMTILLARFLVGLRGATFLLAGSMYMPFRQFFWLDLLAAVVSVPLVTYLGYVFGPHLEALLKLFRRVEVIVLIVVILTVGAIYWFRRARNRQAV
ncbi:MAG: DedA family protein [Nitrospinota bacterium]